TSFKLSLGLTLTGGGGSGACHRRHRSFPSLNLSFSLSGSLSRTPSVAISLFLAGVCPARWLPPSNIEINARIPL
ncbi:hypothetical protein A2U01_0044446, partial [Trifolium medium]|nr:hypothetical protein [Trifolium medium]